MGRYFYYLNFVNYEVEALGSLVTSSKSPLPGYRLTAIMKRHKHKVV